MFTKPADIPNQLKGKSTVHLRNNFFHNFSPSNFNSCSSFNPLFFHSLLTLPADETEDYENYENYYYTEANQDTNLQQELSEEFSWMETSLDSCYSSPCKNGGTCEAKGSDFSCHCPKPYGGTTCEKGNGSFKNCHFGDCLITLTPPYFKCSCKPPYRRPSSSKQCRPNPCKNGGTCIRNRYRSKFTCKCPEPFRGRFCEIGPNDCYEEDSSTYRGRVNQAENGRTCLHWNSHHLLDHPFNAFMEDADTHGIGEHNFCRNPDEDEKPWCYIRKNNEVDWEYCDVSLCPVPFFTHIRITMGLSLQDCSHWNFLRREDQSGQLFLKAFCG
uniref:Hyaluronan binding protein 2 n=1 Tax=Junco hyemalis TaxID=40217 RepID=A0A8C5J240_JUNHY